MTADRERSERKKKGHGNGNYDQLTCDDRDVKKRISLGKGMSGKENITQTSLYPLHSMILETASYWSSVPYHPNFPESWAMAPLVPSGHPTAV